MHRKILNINEMQWVFIITFFLALYHLRCGALSSVTEKFDDEESHVKCVEILDASTYWCDCNCLYLEDLSFHSTEFVFCNLYVVCNQKTNHVILRKILFAVNNNWNSIFSKLFLVSIGCLLTFILCYEKRRGFMFLMFWNLLALRAHSYLCVLQYSMYSIRQRGPIQLRYV